jgi:hypothetical protein
MRRSTITYKRTSGNYKSLVESVIGAGFGRAIGRAISPIARGAGKVFKRVGNTTKSKLNRAGTAARVGLHNMAVTGYAEQPTQSFGVGPNIALGLMQRAKGKTAFTLPGYEKLALKGGATPINRMKANVGLATIGVTGGGINTIHHHDEKILRKRRWPD